MLKALEAFFTEDASLWTLLIGSFVSATLVPVSSEVMLFAVLKIHHDILWPALGVATLGNTAGGMLTYAMGRWIPRREGPGKFEAVLNRHGAATLLLSWTPFVGDTLCLAAGWLRLNWLSCLAFMAVGKGARYVVVALLT